MKSLVEDMLESYAKCGGIKHLNGASLPSKMAVAALTQDLLYVIFPGFIAEHHVSAHDVPHETALQMSSLHKRLKKEIAKSLEMHPVAGVDAESVALDFLRKLPDVRCIIQTDVEAAFQGDPAAASREALPGTSGRSADGSNAPGRPGPSQAADRPIPPGLPTWYPNSRPSTPPASPPSHRPIRPALRSRNAESGSTAMRELITVSTRRGPS